MFTVPLKLLRKLLFLSVLTAGSLIVLLSGTDHTRASFICCEQCDTNLTACLSACTESEKCPIECNAIWQQCSVSCTETC